MLTLSGIPWTVNHREEVRLLWNLICRAYPTTTPTRWRLLHELVDDYATWVLLSESYQEQCLGGTVN